MARAKKKSSASKKQKAQEKKQSVKASVKTSAKTKTAKKTVPKRDVKKFQVQIDEKLTENFIALQKVLTNLSVKFDSLASQISKLIELFEISAKSLAEKDFELGAGKEIKNIDRKIDNLFEQNKVLARGLTLMHDKLPGQPVPRPQMTAQPPQHAPRTLPPRPLQKIQPPQPKKQPSPQPEKLRGADIEGYEKSLSSQPTQKTEFKKLKES